MPQEVDEWRFLHTTEHYAQHLSVSYVVNHKKKALMFPVENTARNKFLQFETDCISKMNFMIIMTRL